MKSNQFFTKVLYFLVIPCLLFVACHEPRDVNEQIKFANQSFMDAFNNGDAASVVTNYTESAQLFPPNRDIIAGRENIQKFWQSVMDMGVKKVELETIAAQACGGNATERGKYRLYSEDGSQIDQGKYIVVWNKVSGVWKLQYDIWNSSNPPAPTRAIEN
ncbi:MAG: DUF4440 domain-containing protein [Bacteroidetes bacterium]|nr:DUF4440 domain-containing protein [Bacteroidota bacterium]